MAYPPGSNVTNVGNFFAKNHGKEYYQHDEICIADADDNKINYVAVSAQKLDICFILSITNYI